MTKPLKIPKEQRSFAAAGNLSVDDLAMSHDRRDLLTGPSRASPATPTSIWASRVATVI
jgi:hypothetical protein